VFTKKKYINIKYICVNSTYYILCLVKNKSTLIVIETTKKQNVTSKLYTLKFSAYFLRIIGFIVY